MTKLPLHTWTAGGGGRKQERVLVGKDRELRFFSKWPHGHNDTSDVEASLGGFFSNAQVPDCQ
jgi:hypothetical protein